MPQHQQNKISQTAIKHYNKLISVRTEALRQLQITTYTGKKLKVNNYWTSLPLMYLRLNINII